MGSETARSDNKNRRSMSSRGMSRGATKNQDAHGHTHGTMSPHSPTSGGSASSMKVQKDAFVKKHIQMTFREKYKIVTAKSFGVWPDVLLVHNVNDEPLSPEQGVRGSR